MTGYTQPDLLPFPDNYNDPADVPADIEALAVATQAALTDHASLATLMCPIGAIVMWPQPSAPAGWHLCNGSAHNSSALQAVLGASTTPDLRDRFIVGAGGGYTAGATGGVATQSLTAAQMPDHAHVITSSDTTVSTNQGSSLDSPYNAGILATNPQSRETSHAGSGAPVENRPPYYALTYIIRKA